MKIITTSYDDNEFLRIKNFGIEDIAENAHWGRGIRDSYILHYVLSGEGYFNNNKVRVEEGFLIKPKDSHEYHSSINQPWSYFWVTFDGKDAERICEEYIGTREGGIFDYGFKPKLLDLCDKMLSEENSIS